MSDRRHPDVSERPRLVQLGPTRWELAAWAADLCVFCPAPLAEGDRIACVEHRGHLDQAS